MSTLKAMLKPFVGKDVGIQVSFGGQLVGVTGTVKELEGGDIVLFRKRQMIEGQPMPTQMGMVREQKIIPESVTYLGDVPKKDVFVLEVQSETIAEAKKLLEADKSPIAIAQPGAVPAGGSGFVPPVR
jgi:hypothetical protein